MQRKKVIMFVFLCPAQHIPHPQEQTMLFKKSIKMKVKTVIINREAWLFAIYKRLFSAVLLSGSIMNWKSPTESNGRTKKLNRKLPLKKT